MQFFNLSLIANTWFCHKLLPVSENEATKILWDFGSFTNIRVQSNRPDIVVFLKNCHRILFVEISCQADVNVFDKESEKVKKYQPLAREVASCYNQPVDIIPIVFEHTGIVSCHQQKYLKKLPCYSDSLFQQLQQAALLGTISISRDNNFKFDVT